MYGGAAVASNAVPTGPPISASPIPQQWWDQDAAQSTHNTHTPGVNVPPPNPAQPPSGVGKLNPNLLPNPTGAVAASAMDVAAAGMERGYYRPGMRSPSPNIQQRLEAMGMGMGGPTPQHPPMTGVNPIHQSVNMSMGLNHPNTHGRNTGASPDRPTTAQHQNTGVGPGPNGAGGPVLAGRARYDGFDTPPSNPATPIQPSPQPVSNNPSSVKPKVNPNGLIRLTLQKPMGIVFEPMADPHNPSQQRGVRICELPRTGAAALSGSLEIGDELLSINDKTMSRKTFDEIMDFIIDADANNVHLLFRRPKKENLSIDPHNTVKKDTVRWMDGTNDNTTENNDAILTQKSSESDASANVRRSKRNDKRSSNSRNRRPIDEESVLSGGEDTYYTQETEETRRRRRSGRSKRSRRDESFLDMLIDSICAPMMGEPNRKRNDDDYSDDETFNSADDDTYVTYDSGSYVEDRNRRNRRGKMKESPSPPPRRKQKGRRGDLREDPVEVDVDEEDEESDIIGFNSKKNPINSHFNHQAHNHPQTRVQQRPVSPPPPVKIPSAEDNNLPPNALSPPSTTNTTNNNNNNLGNTLDDLQQEDPSAIAQRSVRDSNSTELNPHDTPISPQSNPHSSADSKSKLSKSSSSVSQVPSLKDSKFPVQNRFEPVAHQQTPPDQEEYEHDPNIPISELEYDQQNYGADVSVMESVGGPSLLIESNNRQAAPPAPTVSATIVNRFGLNFRKELGLTREETIQLDPDKFYRHVVKGMLEDNEPEKVRLLDKLFAKYSGREEHLILKLHARYADKEEEVEEAEEEPEQEDDEESDTKNSNKENTNFGVSNESSSSQKDSGSLKDSIVRDSVMSNNNSTSHQTNDNDGFQNFGGFPKTSRSSDESKSLNTNSKFGPPVGNGWSSGGGVTNPLRRIPSNEVEDADSQLGSQSKSSGSESDYESIDGSSPAVIAQVSELLNYVYGKTSVPGQIDRVSTIMRAYEGREAVLLELLETKALLKANADESADNLPEYLRRNPALQGLEGGEGDLNPGDPDLGLPQDDMSSDDETSIGGSESLPKQHGHGLIHSESTDGSQLKSVYDHHHTRVIDKPKASGDDKRPDSRDGKKKKKGFFGKVFKKNKKNSKNKESGGAFPSSDGTESKRNRSLMSPRGGKKGQLLRKDESDGSI